MKVFDTEQDLRTAQAAKGVASDIAVGSGEFGDVQVVKFTDGSWSYHDGDVYVLIEETD